MPITETMTIHKALAELKTLDNRIADKINTACYVRANKHSNSKISGQSISDYEQDMKSGFQSIIDLIARRSAIRSALAESNAKTMINVGGKEYAVSVAIEMRQHGIDLYNLLLANMGRQYSDAQRTIERQNGDALTEAATRYVTGLYGQKDKANQDAVNSAYGDYVKANAYDLIDPLNISKEIEKLRDFVDSFMSEVDAKISASNALTEISITY